MVKTRPLHPVLRVLVLAIAFGQAASPSAAAGFVSLNLTPSSSHLAASLARAWRPADPSLTSPLFHSDLTINEPAQIRLTGR